MKIAGCIIRNIVEYTDDIFRASYKGKKFYITTEHGFGKARYNHLTRFLIEVTDIKTGWLDVDAYEDCHNIREAIISALKGACLIQE